MARWICGDEPVAAASAACGGRGGVHLPVQAGVKHDGFFRGAAVAVCRRGEERAQGPPAGTAPFGHVTGGVCGSHRPPPPATGHRPLPRLGAYGDCRAPLGAAVVVHGCGVTGSAQQWLCRPRRWSDRGRTPCGAGYRLGGLAGLGGVCARAVGRR